MQDLKRAGDKCVFEDERLNKTGQKDFITLKKFFHLTEAAQCLRGDVCVWDLGGSDYI